MDEKQQKEPAIRIFGFDISEALITICLMFLIAIPGIHRSVKEDFSVEEAGKWMGAIAGSPAMVRLLQSKGAKAVIKKFKPKKKTKQSDSSKEDE